MSLSSVFNRGLDGLTVAQRGLGVAANNIANANTKGYARQSLIVGARATNGNNIVLGGGAEILGLDTITNSFVEMQLFSSANAFGTIDSRKRTMSQIESLYNESQGQGLAKNMNEFFNSFSNLANNSASIPTRMGVRDQAIALANKFNSMSQQLNSMKKDLSSEIATRVNTINSLSDEIAGLNQSIAQAGGIAKAQDLVVQRTYLLRQLSEEANISYFQDSTGAVQVQLGSGGTLVNGFSSGALSVLSDNLNPGGEVAIGLNFAGSVSNMDVTDQISAGRLGGVLVDRNTTVNDQLTDLDELAYQLTTQFNAAYSGGYGLDGSTGNNFFAPLGSASGAAGLMAVDATVVADVRTIAAAQQDPAVSGVADNRNALTLLALQNSLTMSSGTETFAQKYQGIVGSIGVTANSLNRNFEIQSNLVNQLEVQRESISGVSMDEEGANIIQFQKAFQAASRLMSMASDMMETLLKI